MAQGIVLNQGEFKGKDETQTLQLDGTNYVVSFDVSESSLWLGNKTIDFTGTGNTDTRIEFSNDIEGQLSYTTDGDDIVINIFRTVESDGLGADHTVDKTRIIGTLRIKNGATGFFTDGDRSLFLFGDHNLWDKGSTSPIWLNNFDVGDEKATEKQILKGSYLSEIFYC